MENAATFPRIQPAVFVALQSLFLAVAVVAAGSRTLLRVMRFRRLAADDVFLILATLFFAATTIVNYNLKDLAYLQMEVNLGLTVPPPADFVQKMATYQVLDNTETVLVWASIYAVKLSFVIFFRKIVKSVKLVGAWWWVVLSVVVATAPICMFLGFYICADTGQDFLRVCTIQGMIIREGIYLEVTTALDNLTDLLILSIPIALLWNVRTITWRKRLGVGIVLCLSVFMIIVSIVRVALAPVSSPAVPAPIPDSVWLFFWQNLEAAVAIIMVSVTAFRSMLGQEPVSVPPLSLPLPIPTSTFSRRGTSTGGGGGGVVSKQLISAPRPLGTIASPGGTSRVPVASALGGEPLCSPREEEEDLGEIVEREEIPIAFV